MSLKTKINQWLGNEQKGYASSWQLTELLELGQANWTNPTTSNLAREGFMKNVIAYRCIDLICDALSSIKFQLKDKNGDLIEEHELLDLLHRPNPAQGQSSFLYEVEMHKQIAGNTYIQAIRAGKRLDTPPQELYVLRPDRMKIKPGAVRLPQGYEYKVSDRKKLFFPMDQVTGKSEILHIYFPNPLDDWYGMAPGQPAGMSIDQHNEGSEWNKKLLQNGARPSGMLTTEGSLTQDQRERLRDALQELYMGAQNAGRPFISEGGLKWQDMSLSPKDADFLNGRHSAAVDIANAYGVPPVLLHLPNASSTYNNIKEAKLDLWEQTVLPEVDTLITELNHWLVPTYGDDLTLCYDENAISALQPRRDNKWDKVQSADFLTINEKRKALGFDEVDGGDTILTPANLVPLDMAVDMDEEPDGDEANE